MTGHQIFLINEGSSLFSYCKTWHYLICDLRPVWCESDPSDHMQMNYVFTVLSALLDYWYYLHGQVHQQFPILKLDRKGAELCETLHTEHGPKPESDSWSADETEVWSVGSEFLHCQLWRITATRTETHTWLERRCRCSVTAAPLEEQTTPETPAALWRVGDKHFLLLSAIFLNIKLRMLPTLSQPGAWKCLHSNDELTPNKPGILTETDYCKGLLMWLRSLLRVVKQIPFPGSN